MVTPQLKPSGVLRRLVEVLQHTIPDLLLRTLRRGRGRSGVCSQPPGQRDAKAQDATQLHVRLLDPPSRLPVTPLEQLTVMTLQEQGPTLFPALVERGAQALYRDAIRHGAWAVDIGLFGSGLFTGDVTRELQAGDGILWQIKECKDPVAYAHTLAHDLVGDGRAMEVCLVSKRHLGALAIQFDLLALAACPTHSPQSSLAVLPSPILRDMSSPSGRRAVFVSAL